MKRSDEELDIEEWVKSHPSISDAEFSWLVTTLTHQMRLPMTGLMGYLSMLADGSLKGDKENIYKDLLAVTQNMLGVVNGLMMLAKKYRSQLPRTPAIPPEHKWKVLHFEDDTFLSGMYMTKFRMEGFDYEPYASPTEDPVSIVIKEKPDLIIMDILMPTMNGFDATTLLKSDKRTKDVPIFGLCNLGQPADIQKALDLGMIDYWVTAKHSPTEVVNRARKILTTNKDH